MDCDLQENVFVDAGLLNDHVCGGTNIEAVRDIAEMVRLLSTALLLLTASAGL